MDTISLNSPYSGKPAEFKWNPKVNISEESNDVITIIKHMSEDFEDIKKILNNYNQAKAILKSNENLINLYTEYNKWCDEFRKDNPIQNIEKKRASNKLIKYLMQLVYNRSVIEPDKLNHYEPFSPQVYGETSFDLIDQMLKKVKLNETDTFVDLGSGVGNVVLHVAAASECKVCYGFEKAEWPAYYAARMEYEFKFWMEYFGKGYSRFKLYKADFLSEEEYLEVENLQLSNNAASDEQNLKRRISMNEYVKEIINEANLIFVNNYAFGAEVDHQLKLRFCNMLEGSIIVSSKPFCPLNFRINSRNLNDIGTILNVNEIEPLNGHVSWTDKPINYYFHKIDRTLLEKYFERLKNPGQKKEELIEYNESESKSIKSLNVKSALSPLSCSTYSSENSPSSPSSSSQSSSPSTSSSISPSSKKSNETKRSIIANRKRKINTDDKLKDKKLKKLNENDSFENKKKIKSPSNTKKKLPAASIKNRSKSLDKEVMKTLIKFTEDKSANKNIFNIKKLTNLSNDNLDEKSLKDCKISPKFFKQINSASNAVKKKASLINKEKMLGQLSLLKENNKINESFEIEESIARKELGDDVVNSLDNYLKRCRRNYLRYLMYSKKSEYSCKIKKEIQKEMNINNELKSRKGALEKQTSELLISNVNTLKSKVAELGLADMNSPHDLIQFARDIFLDNEELINKVKTLQQTVDDLQSKTASNNHQHQRQYEELDDKKNHSQTNIVNILLDKFKPTASSIDLANFKKPPPEYNNSNIVKNGIKIENEELNKQILANESVRSVDSSRSSNETLTATERGDLDDDNNDEDENAFDEDDSNDSNNSKANEKNQNQQKELAVIVDDSKKTKNSNDDSTKSSTNNNILPTNKDSKKSTISPLATSKPFIDNLLKGTNSKDSTDCLKNFKIPKQTKDRYTPPQTVSPSSSSSMSYSLSNSPALSTKSTSSFKSSNKNYRQNGSESSIPVQMHTYSSQRQYTSPPLSSNSQYNTATTIIQHQQQSHNTSSQSNDPNNYHYNHQHQSTYKSNYYHPKKNQLRQYSMVSSSCKSPAATSLNNNITPQSSYQTSSYNNQTSSFNHSDHHNNQHLSNDHYSSYYDKNEYRNNQANNSFENKAHQSNLHNGLKLNSGNYLNNNHTISTNTSGGENGNLNEIKPSNSNNFNSNNMSSVSQIASINSKK